VVLPAPQLADRQPHADVEERYTEEAVAVTVPEDPDRDQDEARGGDESDERPSLPRGHDDVLDLLAQGPVEPDGEQPHPEDCQHTQEQGFATQRDERAARGQVGEQRHAHPQRDPLVRRHLRDLRRSEPFGT
jgi:hypothetical protein